ncbi:efflux RND transporter periplasmic adaptor subunit [Alterisphingorhabdus coralli]|uniref:Efflux RND transporter periplasmic adaptor subunit n=1 Tax=Alterisphingorhabdus coralli TaxID=3071408 RepID=A0AA97F5Y7_9SPHN|nr:HlyD family efflux transporter periplasmic adaptor subunit [Parasphingorhabdus sp. SCSIO 66989]WOE73882.1 efflux RND transporter periplasmic adaptor subunit [Parasphingorhabdus sp. SCSIO 66989]
MNKQLRLVLIILVVAAAIAALMVLLRPQPKEKPEETRAPLVQTEELVIESGPLQVLGSGTVQAREEVFIAAEIQGKLVYVNPAFREGRRVNKGTLLFRINSADYENAVESARADVAAQDVAVLQAREEVAIAKSELENFARRNQQLQQVPQGNASDSQILPPRTMANNSTPQATASGTPNRLATREPQLRSARAARQRAGAQLADARLALSRTAVRAPFSGIVRTETAAVGTLVAPGQQLGSLVATDAYEVRVSLTEEEAALVPGLWQGGGAGIPAAITFAYGGARYRWQAYVDRANTLLDANTRTIDIFLRVPNPVSGGALDAEQTDSAGEGNPSAAAPPLLLGSFVDAEIQGIALENYAAIPVSHLRTGNQIWLARDGKLKIVPVKVIQRSDNIAYVEAAELLKGGSLITSNLRAPVDGMAVRVENSGKKPKPKKTTSQSATKTEKGDE